jgi:pyruvate dehydrogenase E2 component (dihydrolipoamide acetyltransferase)
MATEVILPKLGQTMEEGIIVEWLKGEGDPVQRGDVLFTTESDKATLEVEAPKKGFLRSIFVPAGESVPVLTVVGLITKTVDEDVSAYATSKPLTSPEHEANSAALAATPAMEPTSFYRAGSAPGRIFASPRARRLAREKEVDLALVSGTGPNGRIAEKDVKAYLEALPMVTPVARRLAESAELDLRTVSGTGPGGRLTKADVESALSGVGVPEVASAPIDAEPTEDLSQVLAREVPLSGVRAVIARRMHEGHSTTAPVSLTIEVDANNLVALRDRLKASLAQALGFNVGYNDLLIKLVAHALGEYPYMNVRLDQTSGVIQFLGAVHVALAVDTERGLLVPVVRDVDRKRLTEVAREVRDLVERARAGKALPDELSGSTFTITNLGMYEIDAFTPIINLPEAAILGVGRIKKRPVVRDGELGVGQTMWLSLTFDHRLVDGAPAARFLQYVKNLIEDPYLWLAACM